MMEPKTVQKKINIILIEESNGENGFPILGNKYIHIILYNIHVSSIIGHVLLKETYMATVTTVRLEVSN